MTHQPLSSTARAGSAPNKPLPEAVEYARVSEGRIVILDEGRRQPVTRWRAIAILAELEGSPFPTSQERARQIKAALRETATFNDLMENTYGHAH